MFQLFDDRQRSCLRLGISEPNQGIVECGVELSRLARVRGSSVLPYLHTFQRGEFGSEMRDSLWSKLSA
jgi:hypothetical protein